MLLRLGKLMPVLALSLRLPAQTVELRSASTLVMPAQTDSNSPVFWRQNQFYVFNSHMVPIMSWGREPFASMSSRWISVDHYRHFPMWIESVWQDPEGVLFAWYHHEPWRVCPGYTLTVPQIGALVSFDGGQSFRDLGLVLTAGDPPDCSAENGFFAGGHGDFSVILDRRGRYFYFLFSNYGGDAAGQGIGMARMAFEDRLDPSGKVRKYYAGRWEEPGLGGRMTPVFPVTTPWQRADADAFWGPSVHWNTHLETYVVLLNHACCQPGWPAAGIYVSFNTDISDPSGWSPPEKIMDRPPGYYPQVVGLKLGESDSLAGQVARLFVHGISAWEIVFHREERAGGQDAPSARRTARPSTGFPRR